VLFLGVHPPDEVRVDIDVHGRRVIGGAVLRFLRELVTPDALHCYRQETASRKRVRGGKPKERK
jgi:hypothetical protein